MNTPATLALTVTTLALGLLVAGFVAWRVLAARSRPQSVALAADGSVAVPVRQLEWRSGTLFGARTRNGISPQLAILPGGLRFKVFRETDWPFARISRIDAGRTLFGYELRFSGDGTLTASVASAEIVRAALAALPAGAPLTPAALALRGS